mgnify:CR=1 FL=1
MITDLLKNVVEEYYELDLTLNTRQRTHVEARAIYFRLLRDKTKMSLEAIGKTVNRDHATVLYANRKLKDWIQYDSKIKKEYEIIRNKFEHALSLSDTSIEEEYSTTEGFYEAKYKELEGKIMEALAKVEGKEFEDINSVQAFEALDNLFTKYNFLKASFYRTHPKRALARKFDLV